MKRILLILAATLLAGIVCGCDEEKTLPYIPVDRPDDTPPASEDPESHTVTYRLVKVACTAGAVQAFSVQNRE